MGDVYLFLGLLSTSTLRHAAVSDGPPKFTPPTKPVIIDKTQSETSLRRFVHLPK